VLAIPQFPVQDPAINKLVQALFPLGEPKIPFYEHGQNAFQEGRLKFVTIRLNPAATAFGVIVSHTGVALDALKKWREAIRIPHAVSLYACRLQKSDGDMVLGQQFEHVAGPETIPFQVGVATFHLPPMAFFQANRLLLDAFVREVVGVTEQTASGQTLLDLYGGCGGYAAQVAQKFAQVYVVDGNPHAIAGGRKYFQEVAQPHVTLESLYVEEFLAKLPEAQRHKVTHIISNPPRGGMSPEVLEQLQRRHLPNLKYLTFVSCSLLSLQKNLQLLRKKLNFTLERVVGFDMFPQTEHVETVVHLKIKD
jgi:23S rRNA (uracil1939-C5)-methyltransferase